MKAIILAAGKGTRVRPITYSVPKPLIPVLDKPVMELLVNLLRKHGVRQVMVNTSYRASDIESYFRDGSGFGLEIGYSFEGRLEEGRIIDEPVGSAGSIKRIQEHSGFFDQPFAVLCGDAIVDIDLSALLEFHKNRNALVTIALAEVDREEVSSYGVVVKDDDGRISEFQEKPATEEAKSTTVNTGIYIFDPRVIDSIPSGEPFDIGGQLFPELIAKGEGIYGVVLPFQWLDIGKVSDYHRVMEMAVSGQVNNLEVPGTEVAEDVRLGLNVKIDLSNCTIRGPVYIGSGSTIEPGATIIGPTVLGRGCYIQSGAHVERSVLFDYTFVSSYARLNQAIVIDGFFMDSAGNAIEVSKADIAWLVSDSRALRKELTWHQENIVQMICDW